MPVTLHAGMQLRQKLPTAEVLAQTCTQIHSAHMISVANSFCTSMQSCLNAQHAHTTILSVDPAAGPCPTEYAMPRLASD